MTKEDNFKTLCEHWQLYITHKEFDKKVAAAAIFFFNFTDWVIIA